MYRRFITVLLLSSCLILAFGCSNKKVKNPLASVDSKQPDKVLFDRAMDAMQHRKYDVARLSLQTLINTYPDSEYIARAKLGVGDSWYAEGGSAALAQAENEYRDFQTFFPNMPEAAEAQYKIAEIHYRQMEKPDRDYTHAKRAEDEYRQLLLQYPDHKLADTARQKLLEVQEVLGEREYRIGRFYYLRGSWAAAMARLKTLTDTYPLYSQADEALYMLGQALEQEINIIRMSKIGEVPKARLIKQYTDEANAAYSKIITRYPVMPRADDARARLRAMDLAVPTPTQEAIDLNKKEMASRSELSRMGKIMMNFHKHPDMARAAKVGEPTLVDPKETDAAQLIREANDIVKESMTNNKVGVETVHDGKVPESQPIPRSDSGNLDGTAVDPPKPAPDQVNEAASDSSKPAAETSKSGTDSANSTTSSNTDSQTESSSSATSNNTDNQTESSSKKKKKSGLRKIIPF